MARIDDLVSRAEDLGIDDALCDVMEAYIDAAELASEEYEDFHWGERSTGGDLVWLPPPPVVLTEIGPLISVVYEATKRGELAHWDHAFQPDRPVLAYDPVHEDRLYIVGGDYQVTPRGIVG
jgi:hypothetical protein